MAGFTSDKPAKPVEKEEARAEAEVNQDDPSAETSRNPLDSLSSSLNDWYESGRDDYELGQFDDEEMEMVQKEDEDDWVISDEHRPTTGDVIPVNVAMVPIGVVLSVKGKTVLVDGKEELTVLSKGSLLWITETKVPLGFVDDIVRTFEKPCYSVRLESDSQVPEGTQVSLIVAESLPHDKKGCDDNNDEKISAEVEILDNGREEADRREMQKTMGIISEKAMVNTGNKSEQTLPSPNPSDAQAIAGTVMNPNRSDSQVSAVRSQAIDGKGGRLVYQLEPLTRKSKLNANAKPWSPETNNQQNTYQQQYPVATNMGFMIPNPVPIQVPVHLMMPITNPPIYYPQYQPFPYAPPYPQTQSQKLNGGSRSR